MNEQPTTITTFDWQGITLSVTHWPAKFGRGEDWQTDHLEVQAVNPERARLPITETGYVSHYVDSTEICESYGPEAYVRDWLDDEARSPAWRRYVEASRQLSLF